MSTYNPACYLPKVLNAHLPSGIACPPPPVPTYLQSAYTMMVTPFTSTYAILRTMFSGMASLPFLSVLLIPTMTSYSRSLNLLFFYITWSTLILSHPPQRVEMVATLAIRVLFYLLPSTVFLLFDVLVPSAATTFKSRGEDGLPFNSSSRRHIYQHLKVLAWSLFNILLVGIITQSLFEHFLTEILGIRPALKITTTLPLPWSILKDILRGYLLREVFTYTIHRFILHPSSARSTLSQKHRQWYHALTSPFPLSATYDHPVPYLLRTFIPTFLPAAFFHFHLLTYLLYLTVISLEETWSYSGYARFPGGFFVGGFARRVDLHLSSDGKGNFGCCGVGDWVLDTGIGEDVVEDLVEDIEEHRLVERVGERGKKVGRIVRRKVGRVGSGRGSSLEDEEDKEWDGEGDESRERTRAVTGRGTSSGDGVKRVLRRSRRRRDI